MDNIYDTIEREIEVIGYRIASTYMGARIKLIDTKLASVSEKLVKFKATSDRITKEGNDVLNMLERTNKLSKKLSQSGKSMMLEVKEKLQKSSSTERTYGLTITSLAFALVIGVFICIHYRMRAATNKNLQHL